MEFAMTTRALPSLTISRPLISKPLYVKNLRFSSKQGLVYSGSDWSSLTASEEKSSVVVTEEFEDEKPVEKKEEGSGEKEEIVSEAEVKDGEEEEVVVSSDYESEEEKNPADDFLKELTLTLESGDRSKLLIYASGALLTLWVSSIVVSAIDSIPLFPKLMEVIGLGYTVWFTSRYLLFKESRDELFTKVIDLKDQILGSADE